MMFKVGDAELKAMENRYERIIDIPCMRHQIEVISQTGFSRKPGREGLMDDQAICSTLGLRIGGAQYLEHLGREFHGLRYGSVEESPIHHVVRKYQSPVAPTYQTAQSPLWR